MIIQKISDELAKITKDWLQWLRHGRHVSSHTLTAYQRDLASFVTFLNDYHGRIISLTEVAAASIGDFRAWLAALARQEYDLRSSRRALSALRNFYQYLALEKAQKNSAIAFVRLPRLSQTLPRPLTIAQMMELLAQIPELAQQPWVGLRDCALFTLIYATGLRISEALSLKPVDCHAQLILTILGKGRKKRQVPLIPQVHEAIQAYLKACPHHLAEDGPLFVGTSGKPLHASVAQRQLRYYRQILGLPDTATPHALRHSCATHLMGSSHDLRGVQELLGHSSLSTTQIYTKLDTEQLLDTFRQSHPRMGKVSHKDPE